MTPDKITALDHFNSLLYVLREDKPNDRSEQDRYWAITITEVEKARALFLTYCATKQEQVNG